MLFHGGVPGPKRKDLIDRFREDPDCRLFLSTDAGGVGLNLQHASVVVNMDLPWNPAVLEQRIGRVHRLGQQRPVRVVNFIAQGTIEEGMLAVLKFKKSLFAGVLDGGEKEVFLGGSRLNKFMESVEKATAAIPPHDLLDDASECCTARQWKATRRSGSRLGAAVGRVGHPGCRREPGPRAAGGMPAPAGGDPWAGLLQVGMALLQQLAGDAGGSSGGSKGGAPRPARHLGRGGARRAAPGSRT